jgi:hypothetical protein
MVSRGGHLCLFKNRFQGMMYIDYHETSQLSSYTCEKGAQGFGHFPGGHPNVHQAT